MNKEILKVIYDSVDQINNNILNTGRIDKKLDSVIFGKGKIDSLSFVAFVVSVEGGIKNRFDFSIDLADEGILIADVSPFRTINTLVCYIEKLLINNKVINDNK